MCYSGYGAVTNILQMVISSSCYISHEGLQRLRSALTQGLSLQSICDLAAASPKTPETQSLLDDRAGDSRDGGLHGGFLPPQPETACVISTLSPISASYKVCPPRRWLRNKCLGTNGIIGELAVSAPGGLRDSMEKLKNQLLPWTGIRAAGRSGLQELVRQSSIRICPGGREQLWPGQVLCPTQDG